MNNGQGREIIKTYAVNCNDAWLNTDGDDISGSYVKYKDHQAVVAELGAMGAVNVQTWTSVIGGISLQYETSNGGCTLRVIPAAPQQEEK